MNRLTFPFTRSYTSPTMSKTHSPAQAGASAGPRRSASERSASERSASERSASERSALVLWGAAALCLILGFADLWRGGETISAILLTVGYLVLIPLAILKG
jgi:hypothetical protein